MSQSQDSVPAEMEFIIQEAGVLNSVGPLESPREVLRSASFNPTDSDSAGLWQGPENYFLKFCEWFQCIPRVEIQFNGQWQTINK